MKIKIILFIFLLIGIIEIVNGAEVWYDLRNSSWGSSPGNGFTVNETVRRMWWNNITINDYFWKTDYWEQIQLYQVGGSYLQVDFGKVINVSKASIFTWHSAGTGETLGWLNITCSTDNTTFVKKAVLTGGSGAYRWYTAEMNGTLCRQVRFDSMRRVTGGYASGAVDEVNITAYESIGGGVDTTPPVINQNTYNMTSDGGCTVWRTDTSNPCNTSDSTPTVKFTTDENANCRIYTQNVNYTTMGSNRNCTTTGTTSHICTLINADNLTANILSNLTIGCADTTGNENKTSSSGLLAINYRNGCWCLYSNNGNCIPTENCTLTQNAMVGGYLNLSNVILNTSIYSVNASKYYICSQPVRFLIPSGGKLIKRAT